MLYKAMVLINHYVLQQVLENADQLFEDKAAFKGIKNNGSVDLSIFMFSPNRDLWEHLWESVSHNGNSE